MTGAMLTPDVCVIGAGSAGLVVAAAARAVGLEVVLIEAHLMGGECLNTGCVPSKALIAASRHAAAIRRAGAFGVDAGPPVIDAPRVFAHVRAVIDAIAPHDSQDRFERLGVRVVRAPARFLDATTVVAGDVRVRARRTVIATGSRPAIPPVPGLADVPFLTNESLFDIGALPARLLVLGAGPIGLEMAQAFARLGSTVTVVEAARPLAAEDPELAAVVLDRLAAEGVTIRAGTGVAAARRDGAGVALELADGTLVTGDRLLVAAGRLPAVDGLDLEAAGIAHDRRGIATDTAMRTANRRVFAIGDVARSYRFTHWAAYQAGLVVRSILTGIAHHERRDHVAWATYTDPEIASAGLAEAEARARFGDRVRIARFALSANDRAIADGAPEGLVKLVVGPRGRILGGSVVGEGAGETVSLLAMAVANRLTAGAFASTIIPYPTLAEAPKRAALAALSATLERPLAARALGALRWFGRRLG